jgi:hypothetical protein
VASKNFLLLEMENLFTCAMFPLMVDRPFSEAYVENLRRELTRAQARLTRAERERDRALAENATLRARIDAEAKIRDS